MLRISKIVLIVLVALWGAIGGVKNFADVEGGLGSVRVVIDPPDPARIAEWPNIQSPIIVWLGFLTIALGKIAAAGLCGVGAWRMWGARKLDAESFNVAKKMALVGCSVGVAMLFGVFIVAGSTYFNLWMTPVGSVALPIAFQLIGCIALIAIFVSQPDP
jgi:predicted small integral membrane protein